MLLIPKVIVVFANKVRQSAACTPSGAGAIAFSPTILFPYYTQALALLE
jgi:hypothetical protein